jgi:fermentation-respiration switch protein FrsA (DUF1100 family)
MLPDKIPYLRTVIGIIIPLSVCYGLLSPSVAAPLYNKLLFYPDYPTRYDKERYRVDSLQGFRKQDLHIPSSNGTKLHAWLFRNPNCKYVIVVSHGNAGNLSDRGALADDLLQLGFSVLLYDYQGYGLSEGEPSIRNVCDDGLAVYDYLHNERNYGGDSIILYGESLGCAVACNTSANRPCRALILQSGFSSLKQISSEKFLIFKAYPSALFPKPSLDNASILKQIHPPLLLLHGEHDTTVPPSHSKQLFAVASDPKRIVLLPNSGHFVAQEDHQLFMQALNQFLAPLKASSNKDAAAVSDQHHF